MTSPKNLRITLGDLALVAISLDDTVMQHELGVEVSGKGRSNVVTGTPEKLRFVVDDVFSRSNPHNGWDNYPEERAALRRAAKTIRAQLAKQGYAIAFAPARVLTLVPLEG